MLKKNYIITFAAATIAVIIGILPSLIRYITRGEFISMKDTYFFLLKYNPHFSAHSGASNLLFPLILRINMSPSLLIFINIFLLLIEAWIVGLIVFRTKKISPKLFLFNILVIISISSYIYAFQPVLLASISLLPLIIFFFMEENKPLIALLILFLTPIFGLECFIYSTLIIIFTAITKKYWNTLLALLVMFIAIFPIYLLPMYNTSMYPSLNDQIQIQSGSYNSHSKIAYSIQNLLLSRDPTDPSLGWRSILLPHITHGFSENRALLGIPFIFYILIIGAFLIMPSSYKRFFPLLFLGISGLFLPIMSLANGLILAILALQSIYIIDKYDWKIKDLHRALNIILVMIFLYLYLSFSKTIVTAQPTTEEINLLEKAEKVVDSTGIKNVLTGEANRYIVRYYLANPYISDELLKNMDYEHISSTLRNRDVDALYVDKSMFRDIWNNYDYGMLYVLKYMDIFYPIVADKDLSGFYILNK